MATFPFPLLSSNRTYQTGIIQDLVCGADWDSPSWDPLLAFFHCPGFPYLALDFSFCHRYYFFRSILSYSFLSILLARSCMIHIIARSWPIWSSSPQSRAFLAVFISISSSPSFFLRHHVADRRPYSQGDFSLAFWPPVFLHKDGGSATRVFLFRFAFGLPSLTSQCFSFSTLTVFPLLKFLFCDGVNHFMNGSSLSFLKLFSSPALIPLMLFLLKQ